MKGLESIYCDDIKKKKEGVEVEIPDLEGAFLTVKAFDKILLNEELRRNKYDLMDPENPTAEESRLLLAKCYVKLFVPSWRGIFLNGKELEDTESERLRILTDERFERLLDVAIQEMNKVSNFKLKELDEAKKPYPST